MSEPAKRSRKRMNVRKQNCPHCENPMGIIGMPGHYVCDSCGGESITVMNLIAIKTEPDTDAQSGEEAGK